MLTVTQNWIDAMGRNGCEPVFLVHITTSLDPIDVSTKFVSSVNTTTTYDPSVQSVADISSKIKLVDRTTTASNCSVLFVNDGSFKDLIVAKRLKGKKITILLGEATLDEADYAPYFSGYIDEIKPTPTTIEVLCKNVYGYLEDQRIKNKSYYNLHPLQAIEDILELSDVPESLYDSSSLDPTQYTTISHFVVSRANYGAFNCSFIVDEKAKDLVEELCVLLQGSMCPLEDGKLTFKFYDPSAAADDNFTQDDIADFVQDTTVEEVVNSLRVDFGTGTYGQGSTGGGDGGASNAGHQAHSDSQPLAQITLQNTDSIQSFYQYPLALPGTKGKVFERVIRTPWCNPVVDWFTALDNNDLSFKTVGGHFPNFCGQNTGDPSFEISADRLAYILISDHVAPGLDKDFNNAAVEVVVCDNIVQDTTVYVDVVSQEWPNTFTSTSGTLVASGTYTIKANGRDFTKDGGGEATGVDWTDETRVHIRDATIPVWMCERIIERCSGGVVKATIKTSLNKYAVQLGDIITLEEPQFMSFGTDGVTASNKWEVISKSVKSSSHTIEFELSKINSQAGYIPNWSPKASEGMILPPEVWDHPNISQIPQLFDPGTFQDIFTPTLQTPVDLGGLIMKWKDLIRGGPTAPFFNPSFTTTLTDNTTTYVGFDFNGIPLFNTNASNFGTQGSPVTTAVTSGGSITSITDTAPQTGWLGQNIKGFPGFQGTNLQFPYWDNGVGGLFLNTTDNVALIGAPSGFDTYAEIVEAQSSYVFYRFEDPPGFTSDSSGNARTALLAQDGPTFGATGGLIRSNGAAVGECAHFNQNTSVSGDSGSLYREEVDTTTSIGWSMSVWVVNVSVAATELVILSGAEQTGTAAGDDVIKVVQDIGDNELQVTIHQSTVSFTNASLGMNIGDGDTHHLVVTWDATSGEVDVWIDGILRGYAAIVATMDKEVTLAFGCEVDNAGAFSTTKYWDGLLDEFGYWNNKVLSTEEIIAQHTAGGINFGGAGPAYTPIVASGLTASEMGITADDISETADRKFSTGSASDIILPSTNIIVGNSSGVGQARTMGGDATIAEDGTVTVTASAPSTLTDGDFFIGNGSDVATAQTLSGAITSDNVGATTLGGGIVGRANLTTNMQSSCFVYLNADQAVPAADDWHTPTGLISPGGDYQNPTSIWDAANQWILVPEDGVYSLTIVMTWQLTGGASWTGDMRQIVAPYWDTGSGFAVGQYLEQTNYWTLPWENSAWYTSGGTVTRFLPAGIKIKMIGYFAAYGAGLHPTISWRGTVIHTYMSIGKCN